MENKLITFHNGLVTARDASALNDGELTEAVGCEYREGSPHIYKQPGRAAASGGSYVPANVAGRIHALHYLQYDTGTDKLVFYTSGGKVFESNVWTTSGASVDVDDSTHQLTGLDTSAIPSFASLRDRWVMVNGVDNNYIREPNDVPGGSTGAWRTCGMQAPIGVITQGTGPSSAGQAESVDTEGGDTEYVSDANAYDGDDETYAYGVQDLSTSGSKTQDYTWGSNWGTLPVTNGVLKITHSGSENVRSKYGLLAGLLGRDVPFTGTTGSSQQIIVTDTSGPTELYNETFKIPYSKQTITVALDARDLTNIEVTCITNNTHDVGWKWEGSAIGKVHVIQADTQSATAEFTTGELTYAYTEFYRDSDGIAHESNLSEPLTVAAQTDVFGIKLENFPGTALNDFATEYIIYRSLDEEGGGYPFLYEIDRIVVGTTEYVDLGDTSFTLVAEQKRLYPTVNILYPDGSTGTIEINGSPPPSKKVLPFQGSMVYVPVQEPRIFYSMPASISPVAIEQVPAFYYLEFVTPYNDTPTSAEASNSGRAMIVYFERYSMLVNYLPQATDPGVFDQRILEYVSNTRGCVGPHASTEVTLETGRTFAVAVDALGVWATDGVSEIIPWSSDLDWDTLMSGVDMDTIRLIDNPEMDRLEMLYDTGSNVMREMHFYYGRMKGKLPLITGPHLASSAATDGWYSKHYANVDNTWVGWSGDNSTTGDVFVEREQAADDSLAYDGANTYVPFQVTTPDFYIGQLGRAHMVGFGYPKFASGAKTLSPSDSSNRSGLFGTFYRDGNTQTGAPRAMTQNKKFVLGTYRKVYWHMLCDRHKVQIKNVDSTDLPALIAYEIELRDGGVGRDL